MMHKAGKLEEKKKKKIPSVLVALRDAITFLRQLPISSAAESMYSPVWSCVLLMTDHDTSLILLLGALYSFESTLNITGKNPLTYSSDFLFILFWRQKEVQGGSGEIIPAEQH